MSFLTGSEARLQPQELLVVLWDIDERPNRDKSPPGCHCSRAWITRKVQLWLIVDPQSEAGVMAGRWIQFFASAGSGMLTFLAGCSGFGTSRWAMDDPIYAEKYDQPY